MSQKSFTELTVSIRLRLPPGVTQEQTLEYVHEAVTCWKKGGDPALPINSLDENSVVVRLLKRETTYL